MLGTSGHTQLPDSRKIRIANDRPREYFFTRPLLRMDDSKAEILACEAGQLILMRALQMFGVAVRDVWTVVIVVLKFIPDASWPNVSSNLLCFGCGNGNFIIFLL